MYWQYGALLQITCRTAFTWWHQAVGQSLEYLDNFDIHCGHGEFLRQWRMTWGERQNKKAIRYVCCRFRDTLRWKHCAPWGQNVNLLIPPSHVWQTRICCLPLSLTAIWNSFPSMDISLKFLKKNIVCMTSAYQPCLSQCMWPVAWGWVVSQRYLSIIRRLAL